jgi:uncharacterized membrane protein
VLATAAAALFTAGIAAATGAQAEEAKVRCDGVTGCKGESDCKTAGHSCKGHNGCMGEGFKYLSRAECEKKGGKIVEGAPADKR